MAGVTARRETAQSPTIGRRSKRTSGSESNLFGLAAVLSLLAAAGVMAAQFFRSQGRKALSHYPEVESHFDDRFDASQYDDSMGIMQEVRLIGGAIITIAVIVLVLNEVLSVNAIANTTGPFSGVIDTLESTGGSALTLLVIGLLVVAAMAIMRFFNGNF